MNPIVAKELQILWSDFDENDIEQKIEALERLKKSATKDDLPQLISALKSEKNDFWIRELLADAISEFGGSEYLPELFEALQKNFDEGHDNDGFQNSLTEIAYLEPELCKQKLLMLINDPNFKYENYAKWLIDFCEN